VYYTSKTFFKPTKLESHKTFYKIQRRHKCIHSIQSRWCQFCYINSGQRLAYFHLPTFFGPQITCTGPRLVGGRYKSVSFKILHQQYFFQRTNDCVCKLLTAEKLHIQHFESVIHLTMLSINQSTQRTKTLQTRH